MFVHSSRIKKQIEYLKSKGIDTSEVFELAEIKNEEVDDPKKMFSFEQYNSVLEFAIQKTRDEFYGLHFGNNPYVAGSIGMLGASCKNMKEAFKMGCKYFKAMGTEASLNFIEDSPYPKLIYNQANVWKLQYPETARQSVDILFSYIMVILNVNSNNTIKPHKIKLTWGKPQKIEEYEKIFGIRPNFNQKVNEFIFNEADLRIPMKAFNAETLQLLQSHFNESLKRMQNKETFAEKVKSVLLSSVQYQFPDIERVSEKLKISPRTLQRQLSNEETSFKIILQETKFDMAKQLLKQNNLSVSEVGYTLGYSDVGNFSRSFKKYVGVSPQEYKITI